MSRKGKATRESWDAVPDGAFVGVAKATLKEPAWKAMSYGARCLYFCLKSYFNGRNNGRIFLSVRRAADELGAGPTSIERWFKELQDFGWIRPTEVGHLGVDGQGKATCWRLTEIGFMGQQPTRDYRQWQAQEKKPVPKIGETVPKIGTPSPQNKDTCPQNEDSLGPFQASDCPQNEYTVLLPSRVGGREDDDTSATLTKTSRIPGGVLSDASDISTREWLSASGDEDDEAAEYESKWNSDQ
ncbi:hypothetical protein [Consotaella salsifontis]|uniref:Helix-turn-helix domain-containing protein n=1 Tax=Consotaella salsifontis TaxID=1365950 RepID=A0A1T4SJS0_9HYPH|nr:hypothetical protein [Consotaella salsifontis]SKA28415.1 hypothetical protein SAMN05428963_11178 [Consotaella salsifontis]